MMKWIKFFTLVSLLSSCSTMDKNISMNSSIILSGGHQGADSWDEELVLKRSSWFKELTMYYDVLYTRIDRNSPFYNWFSSGEKSSLEKCSDIIVASHYAFRPRDISKTMFKNEMLKQGYEAIRLNNFERHIRMHPDFARFQMDVYSSFAFCGNGSREDDISIQFPGFKEVFLEL